MKNKAGSILLVLAMVIGSLMFAGCEGEPIEYEYTWPSELVGVWRSDTVYADNAKTLVEKEACYVDIYLYSSGKMEFYVNGTLQEGFHNGADRIWAVAEPKDANFARLRKFCYGLDYHNSCEYEIDGYNLIFNMGGVSCSYGADGYFYELQDDGTYKKLYSGIQKFKWSSWLY